MLMLQKAYGLLTRLYPRPFWEKYEEELTLVFAARGRRERKRGSFAFASFLVWTVADVLLSSTRMHLRNALTALGLGFRGVGRALGRALNGDLSQDIRFSFRRLKIRPGFSATAILYLALGIGANTVIFGVVDTLVLRPLPFEEPERLVRLYGSTPGNSSLQHLSARIAEELSEMEAFEETAVLDFGFMAMAGKENAEVVSVGSVSPNFFGLLGIQPVLGSGFDSPGFSIPDYNLVVLSYDFWRARFEHDATIISSTIVLDGSSYRVVGVLSEDFEDPAGGVGGYTQLWRPRDFANDGIGDRWLGVIGRLAPEVSVENANAAADAAAQAMALMYPDALMEGFRIIAVPLHEAIWGDVRSSLLVLLFAGGIVLIVGCVNLAGLLLANGLERSQEMVTRTALGAGRWRIVRQLMIENAMLVVFGGAFGVLLANSGLGFLQLLQNQIPRLADAQLSFIVVAFAVALSAIIALIFGLPPAMASSSPAMAGALRSGPGARGKSRRTVRLRSLLVGSQLTVSLTLMVIALISMKSFRLLSEVDTGYEPRGVFTFQLSLPRSTYSNNEAITVFQDALLERLASVPGVEAVAAVDKIPLGTRSNCSGFRVLGLPALELGEWTCAERRVATPGYFSTMGIDLLRGRDFTAGDNQRAERVAVVNRAFANLVWPGENPIGKQVAWHSERVEWSTIVGVVADVRHFGLDTPPQPEVYSPHPQAPDGRMTFVIRAPGVTQILRHARAAVAELDRSVPLRLAQDMERFTEQWITPYRAALIAAAAITLLAIALTLIGVSGVLAHAVSQRRPEIGIRLAMGAGPREVGWMVVKHGLKIGGLAVAVSLLPSLALAKIMSAFLYGLSGFEVPSFLIATSAIVSLVILMSYLPAHRAARINPAEVLRDL